MRCNSFVYTLKWCLFLITDRYVRNRVNIPSRTANIVVFIGKSNRNTDIFELITHRYVGNGRGWGQWSLPSYTVNIVLLICKIDTKQMSYVVLSNDVDAPYSSSTIFSNVVIPSTDAQRNLLRRQLRVAMQTKNLKLLNQTIGRIEDLGVRAGLEEDLDRAVEVRAMLQVADSKDQWPFHLIITRMTSYSKYCEGFCCTYYNTWSSHQFERKNQSCVLLSICEGNPPIIGGFPSQRVSNVKNVSMLWLFSCSLCRSQQCDVPPWQRPAAEGPQRCGDLAL